MLIASWVAMTIIGLIAVGAIKDSHLRAGNPVRLTNPMDYMGNLCGFSEGYGSKKYGYYLPDRTGMYTQLIKTLFTICTYLYILRCP